MKSKFKTTRELIKFIHENYKRLVLTEDCIKACSICKRYKENKPCVVVNLNYTYPRSENESEYDIKQYWMTPVIFNDCRKNCKECDLHKLGHKCLIISQEDTNDNIKKENG